MLLSSPPTEPLAFLEALIAYVDAADPGFRAQLRGATPEQIQRYARATGAFVDAAALPAFFATFLQRMGQGNGGLFDRLNLTVTVDEVLEIYADYAQTEPELVDHGLAIVGGGTYGDPIALDLTTRLHDPEVVVLSAGERARTMAESWRHFVTHAAIRHAEPRRRAMSYWYSSSPESAARVLGSVDSARDEIARRVELLAARLLLAPCWPSDAWQRVAANPTTTLLARLGSRAEIMLYVYSDDAAIFPFVGELVRDQLGARGARLSVAP